MLTSVPVSAEEKKILGQYKRYLNYFEFSIIEGHFENGQRCHSEISYQNYFTA